MKFLTEHWILILVLLIVAWLVAAGSAMLEAYLDFKSRPKEAMFWCHRHGYFRKKHCLPLFPDMEGTAENSFICPTCYREAVFTTPNKKAKVN